MVLVCLFIRSDNIHITNKQRAQQEGGWAHECEFAAIHGHGRYL